LFFVGISEATDEKSKIQIRNLMYGFKYPDLSQNVMDPEIPAGGLNSEDLLVYWWRNAALFIIFSNSDFWFRPSVPDL
jgi:hypothetical protein